MLMRHSEKF